MQPVLESVRMDLQGTLSSIDRIITGKHIKEALRWLYVNWAYRQGKWFLNTVGIEQSKKGDLWMERLESRFELYGAAKVTPILNTTKQLAKKHIVSAIQLAQTGASIDRIQEAISTSIRDEGGVISDGRARTIARTEVMSASNTATHEAVKATGAKVEKSWITGGINIRDTHHQAEAQGWIGFEDWFRVGAVKMRHPQDPEAQGDAQAIASETINCKCVEIFRVID